MPPRPFPLSLNIGTDICHTARFEKYFIHHPGGTNSGLFRLFDKFLLPNEQRLFWRRFPLVPKRDLERMKGAKVGGKEEERKAGTEEMGDVMEEKEKIKGHTGWDEDRIKACVNFVGGRWAAKEAIIKAYSPSRRLLLRDMEIRQDLSTNTPYGIVLDAPTSSSAKDYLSAKSIFTQILEQKTLESQSTLPIESTKQQKQHPSSRILSEDGILDLSAVKNALSSSIPPTSTATTLIRKHPSRGNKAQQAADRETKKKWEEAQDAIELADLKGQVVKLSISHDGEYCVATALAAL